MTPEQYQAWKASAETNPAPYWRHDPAQMRLDRTMLLYKGNGQGQFIRISHAGLMEIGSYDGAEDGIGGATFTPLGKQQFPGWIEAYEKAAAQFGIAWLADEAGIGRRLPKRLAKLEKRT